MNAAHLHLLVNHVPIVGFAIALLLLGVTMLRRAYRGIFLASVLVLVVAAVGAVVAQLTGEPAEEAIENFPDVPKGFIEEHEAAATIATIAAGITALLALLVLFIRRDQPVGVMPMSVLVIATVLTCIAMAWTGSIGGKIRHPEIRNAEPLSSRAADHLGRPQAATSSGVHRSLR